MTKFPRTYDSIGRLIINGETAYLAHSGKKYFCFGFAKDAETFWAGIKNTFQHRMSRGYSFTVEPVLKNQEIKHLIIPRVKETSPKVTLIN